MSLDLNLLTALDALLEEGSVAGAADRLRLSSPAMSRTLGRIRRATGDPIMVRTGRTMAPTPYALGLRADVHRLVEQARTLLAPERELDLAGLNRTFTVRFHDVVADAIGPDLVAAVRDGAPGATHVPPGQDQPGRRRRGHAGRSRAPETPGPHRGA
jgi:DNA-binding transcriptional LysR family regulator